MDMDVKARLAALKLLEKSKEYPEFFEEIGVKISMETVDIASKENEKISYAEKSF